MKKKSDVTQNELVNFVARHMHSAGCSTKVEDDKKSKMKRGEEKHKVDRRRMDY